MGGGAEKIHARKKRSENNAYSQNVAEKITTRRKKHAHY
jgi:hypothetical protein